MREIAGCAATWATRNIIDDSVERIRAQVGKDQVLLGLSGGVDSSVLAALLHKAIGTQLTCVFVDHGLLRLGEGDQVMATFAEHMGVRVLRVDAKRRFLSALDGETDPEKKRKIIGRVFIDVFDEEAAKLADVRWLAQGTIYPDVIESAGSKTGKAHVIKSHHSASRGGNDRLHDGTLGAAALRVPGCRHASDHQRGGGDIACGVRHFGEAVGDDRVGVIHFSSA